MSKSLTIGIVIDTTLDLTDGVQQYVLSLGDWLQGQGHEVHYLSGESDPTLHSKRSVYSLAKNITVRGNNNRMSIPLYGRKPQIKEALGKHDFDVLHVQMPYHPFLAGRIITRSDSRVAVVTSCHIVEGSWFIALGSKVLAALQFRSLGRVDTFLSVSSAAQSYLRSAYGKDSRISPNVVTVSNYKKGTQRPFLRGDRATIVFLGRLVERKGANHLLKAVYSLKMDGQLEGVMVHICGDGPMREELELYVSDKGLSNNVIFHGFIDESAKADYLVSADVAVFPSTGGESFGIVLVEAMATNNPIVLAGNNEGYSTVMEGSKNQLFDPHDFQDLANKIADFVDNEKLAKQARSWQRKRVKDFDVETVGPQVVKLYLEAIKSRS